MKLKNFLIPLCLLVCFSLLLSGCASTKDSKTYYFDEDGNMSTTKPQDKVAEKLEIYYFHSTARCYSCQTMGELLSSLVNERYSQQVKEGKIDFRQLNVDLPENKEVARKYQASGSSLFINQIIDGQDKIGQDANVWRYLSNKANFNKYLGDKIDSYLGL